MPSGREGFPALDETIRAFDIPKEYFFDLLRGVEMDLDRDRYATFEELREYCYCVASVVGLIMTNILRDVGEDWRMGRVYVPQEDLARFRYQEPDLASGVIDQNFVDLMRFQAARARGFYRRSEAGIPFLADPGARRTVRIMGRAYRRILDKIEQNRYDVFARRAFVSFPEKLLIAAGSIRPGPGGVEGA
jgi:phytoene synthase